MFCQNKKGALGLEEADGSFAEYVIADSMFTVPIPDNVSFADTVNSPSPSPSQSPFLPHILSSISSQSTFVLMEI
jgi:hypothetical protein